MGKNTVTMNDIAELAGVSKATVSRVFSAPEKVNPSTRRKIQKIIEENNFVPNYAAQSLAGIRTKTIGIVVSELYNPFFMEVIEGVDAVVSDFDYSLLVFSSKWKKEKEVSDVVSLTNKRVDGVILAPIDENSGSIAKLKNSDVPFVLINFIPEDKTLNYVAFNNYAGGRMVAEFVNQIDKAQMILLAGYAHQTLDSRVRGFMDYVDNPESVIKYEGVRTFEDGIGMVSLLKARHSIESKKTVIFVTNDNVSIGLISELASEGIKIPEQVSVIGFDNIKMAAMCSVPLTTISQSMKDMGRLAAYDLLDLINGMKINESGHILEPKLVERESAR